MRRAARGWDLVLIPASVVLTLVAPAMSLGMPTAGEQASSDGLSYALPSWHFLDPNRYPGAEGERWTVLAGI